MTNTGFALFGGMEMPTKSKSLTTTKRKSDGAELEEGARMPALHPGEMLREEFMKPLGLSSNALAMELRVPVTRISEIVRERRGITADTALRLARYFNMSPEFWMRLQMDFDLESAAEAEESAIHQEIRPRAPHAVTEDAEQRIVA
jgi:addiction module HigA family antidote